VPRITSIIPAISSATGTAAPGTRPAHPHRAASKVQSLDGRWLSIDGRVLHAISISASVAKQRCARVHVLRQQTLPRSARWWEVVSPTWSFWRWILGAGDLKGLE
jgi:hypothetical protein